MRIGFLRGLYEEAETSEISSSGRGLWGSDSDGSWGFPAAEIIYARRILTYVTL
jgi:hypothetical protein